MGEAGGKAGGNAGGNGNFEVGHAFRNSFPKKVRTQNAKACFGKKGWLSRLAFSPGLLGLRKLCFAFSGVLPCSPPPLSKRQIV